MGNLLSIISILLLSDKYHLKNKPMHLPKIYGDVASTPGTARDNQPNNKMKTMAKKTISVEVGTGRGAPIFTKSSCKLEKKLRLTQEMTTAD